MVEKSGTSFLVLLFYFSTFNLSPYLPSSFCYFLLIFFIFIKTLHARGGHGSPNENEVQLSTKNNKEMEQEDRVGGLGLNNLRNRLNLIYPNQHTFEIDENESFYESGLTINL